MGWLGQLLMRRRDYEVRDYLAKTSTGSRNQPRCYHSGAGGLDRTLGGIAFLSSAELYMP